MTDYQDRQEMKQANREAVKITAGILSAVALAIVYGPEAFSKVINFFGGIDGFQAFLSGH